MGEIQKCPMCLKKHEINYYGEGWMYYYCNNKEYPCVIHETSISYECTIEEKEKRLNAIYNFVFNKPFYNVHKKSYWKFFYDENEGPSKDEYINVYHLMKSYPNNIVTRVDAILLNLEKLNPKFFSKFDLHNLMHTHPRLFYPDILQKSEDIKQHYIDISNLLSKLKFIEKKNNPFYGNAPNQRRDTTELTYEAWQRIDALNKQKKTSKNIFIAMSFDKSVEYIENAFKEAILAAGYIPNIIKDKEHNNYIMPEIFNAIENAAGVVVDVTEENLGAYYEADYALGKNKEVIVCCKEEKKPHFDIAQKNMIIWKDIPDLIEKLKNRIQATIK